MLLPVLHGRDGGKRVCSRVGRHELERVRVRPREIPFGFLIVVVIEGDFVGDGSRKRHGTQVLRRGVCGVRVFGSREI